MNLDISPAREAIDEALADESFGLAKGNPTGWAEAIVS
jgi:hypothetical protein